MRPPFLRKLPPVVDSDFIGLYVCDRITAIDPQAPLPFIHKIELNVNQYNEDDILDWFMPWLSQLRGLESLVIGEFCRPREEGGKKKKKGTGKEEDDDDEEDEDGDGEEEEKEGSDDDDNYDDDYEGPYLGGEELVWPKRKKEKTITVAPEDWEWLEHLVDAFEEGDFSSLKDLTLKTAWTEKSYSYKRDGEAKSVRVPAVPPSLFLNLVKQCPSGLRSLNLGRGLNADTFESVINLLVGPEGLCALEELTMGFQKWPRTFEPLTAALHTGRFASSIRKILFEAIHPGTTNPATGETEGQTEAEKKAAMDQLFLPLIEALRHCRQFEQLALSSQPFSELVDFCTIAPAMTMVENVIQGFWPHYIQAPIVPREVPASGPHDELDLYITKIGQAFGVGGYRNCYELVLGLREGVFVGARPVAELLQQIHTPLPMLKTMGLRVSTADPEAVEMMLEELLLFVAGGGGGGGEEQEGVGGKCPSLEKLLLQLDEPPLSKEAMGNVMRLVKAAMRHPMLKEVQVLWNHAGPSLEEGEAPTSAAASASASGKTTNKKGKKKNKKKTTKKKKGQEVENAFLERVGLDLLEDGEGIPSDRTIELLLATIKTRVPGKYETFVRYTYHHRHCPDIDKILTDPDSMLRYLQVPYMECEWRQRFGARGKVQFAHDRRCTRIRADDELNGGAVSGVQLGFVLGAN
jgi:hypothetical protein